MVSTPNKHHNATNARKLADKNLTQPGRFLLIVGQPLFTALVILINTLYRTTITTGLLVRDVFKNIPNGSKERNIDNLKRNKVSSNNSTQLKEQLLETFTENKLGFSAATWLFFRRLRNSIRWDFITIRIVFFEINQLIKYVYEFAQSTKGSLSDYLNEPVLTKKQKGKKKTKKTLQLSNVLIPYENKFFKPFKKAYLTIVNSLVLFISKRQLEYKIAKKYLFSESFRKRVLIKFKLTQLPLFIKRGSIQAKKRGYKSKTIHLLRRQKKSPGKIIRLEFLRLKLQTTSHLNPFKHYLVNSKPKIILFGLGGMLLGLGISLFIFWALILADLPSPTQLTTRSDYEVSTKIYDRNGILLYKIFKNKNRTPVALANIPINVRLATLAIEDAEFYSHPGFSIRGIARSFIKNFEEGELAGGSTITQQLVKNAFLTREKTLIRKLKEVTLAMQVEMHYSKDEILEMYLNEVPYGGTAYGIQEASSMYFSKEVGDLTLAEAALLAGLPKSPTQFSPFGSNPETACLRQKQVLRLMEINGYITDEQKQSAACEDIAFSINMTDIKAPHFVMYIRQLLEEKYGREMVEMGGLDVITSLDYNIQSMAEEIVKEEVEKLTRLNVGNGAALVLRPGTGEILAMVGSKNYFDTKSDGNVNIATTLQSPGSSIKIVNYAYALANGYSPSSVLNDQPITYNVAGSPPYTPRNYDGTYKNKVTLRSALAESRNIPAVGLLNSYGVTNMIALGQEMGITTWITPNRYGLSLTLGGADVTMLDLARVYATVANYGKRPDIVPILKVTNYKGKLLEEFSCETNISSPLVASSNNIATDVTSSNSAYVITKNVTKQCDTKQVIDPRVAYILTDILKDNDARAPAFGQNSQLVIPNHKEVAVKTGTSNELRDNLTVGYNQFYLVTVWVGNNDNTPMSRIASGITGAAPIFNRIMTNLVANDSNHDWEVPEGLTKVPICTITGTLACSGCPTKEEWFLAENQPSSHCSEEWLKRLREEDEKKKNKKDNEQEKRPGIFFFRD